MTERGIGSPINSSYGRDGEFDPEALCLVFERGDLNELARAVTDDLAVSVAEKPRG
jgi:hypothetical protein